MNPCALSVPLRMKVLSRMGASLSSVFRFAEKATFIENPMRGEAYRKYGYFKERGGCDRKILGMAVQHTWIVSDAAGNTAALF